MDPTGRIRHIATWLALAASLGTGLLFVVVRGTVPSDGARVSFYGDGWSAAGVRIAPIDAPAAGLEGGDIVTAVDGRSLEAWLEDATNGDVVRPDTGRPIPYRLIRGDAPLSAAVTWASPAIGATLLEGWSVVVFSVATAVIAAFVYARRPEEPAAIALVLGACGAAGSSIPWFLGVTASDIVNGGPFLLHSLVTGPLYMLLWPASVHLALVFPATMPVVTRRRWIVPSVYVVAFAAYGLAMITGRLATPTALEWVGTWPVAQVAVVVPLLALTVGLLARSYVRTQDADARARIRWTTLGAVASGTLGLLLFMLPVLVLRRTLLPESALALTALPMPLGLAAGILRYRLFDIDVVVNRALVYGCLTLAVVASYVIATSLFGAVVGTEHGFGASLLATGSAALLALPLRDVLQRSVDRLMYGERREPWRAMRRLGQRLEWAADPERAFPAIVDTVADSLRLPYVALEAFGEDGAREIVGEFGASRGSTVAMPLIHGATTVGRLVLGIRPGELGFREDERSLLEDLARQAGSTLHAIRLHADLARSRERLVLAREEERRRLRRDLHDGLGPSLAAIGLRAEASAETLATDPAGARHLLDELGADVQVALAEIRRLVDGLRPAALDELGLLGAIDQQASRLEGRSGATPTVEISVHGRPAPLPDLPAAVEVAAYRIAVEALTNVIRHARARTCRVLVEADSNHQALTVEVVDDGGGLPAGTVRGTGLESMSARAGELGGSLTVECCPSGGTRVVASLPLGGAVRP